jgi:hypothetical protein
MWVSSGNPAYEYEHTVCFSDSVNFSPEVFFTPGGDATKECKKYFNDFCLVKETQCEQKCPNCAIGYGQEGRTETCAAPGHAIGTIFIWHCRNDSSQ